MAASDVLRAAAYLTALFTLGFSAASVLAAWKLRAKAGRGTPPSRDYPPLTVLKPVKGLDREMRENLASFLSQDYPAFQVIFCLQDPADPALAVLRRLKEEFPKVDVEIVVSNRGVGFNPKVNNLSNAASFIKHGLLLISDSDIRIEPGDLRKLVDPVLADPNVGLVTCFYQSRGARGLGAAMEFLSVNTQFLPQAMVAAELGGMRFAMGAVMLIPMKVFTESGGFADLSQHLADDYCLGKSVERLGYKIALAEPVVVSVPDDWGVGAHFAHLVRWSMTIRLCQPGGYFGSILLHGFALSCLNALVQGFSPASIHLMLAVAAARAASMAWIHLACVGNPEILAKLPLLPLSDVVQFLAWLAGFGPRKVHWRGARYLVRSDGRLVPL